MSAARGQGNLWKVGCFCSSNFSVGRDQLRFGLANVGPPLQQAGGQPCRNFRRMRLLGQLRAPRDGARVFSKKRAQEVFLLLAASLQVGNGFSRGGHQLLLLTGVEVGWTRTTVRLCCELI